MAGVVLTRRQLSQHSLFAVPPDPRHLHWSAVCPALQCETSTDASAVQQLFNLPERR
jgi:hypothetical protein